MTLPQTVAGCDISKHHIDVALLIEHQCDQFFRVANDDEGIRQLLQALAACNSELCLFEATGGYERLLHTRLEEAQIACFKANPKRIRDFARATGQLAKTDKIDARMIALYGRSIELNIPIHNDVKLLKLRSLYKRRSQLVEIRALELRHREQAFEDIILQQIFDTIKMIEEQIKALDATIDQLLDVCEQFKQRYELYLSMKGVGRVSALALLLELPELGHLDKNKIAALVGVAPYNCDSGHMRGKRRIWGGRAALRQKLYMAAQSARRFNPVIKTFYEKMLEKGKPHKVAIIACLRKMLVILCAMVQKNQQFREI